MTTAEDENAPKPTVIKATGIAGGVANVQGVGSWFQSLPPDHQIFNLVGQVASRWAALESTLDVTIWMLAGIPNQRDGACVTAQMMGVWPRFNAIIALLKSRTGYWDEKTLDGLLKLINKLSQDCRDPSEERNRIVHDPWFILKGEQTAQFRSMPKGEPLYGFSTVAADSIGATLNKIDALTLRARALHTRVLAVLSQHTSHEMKTPAPP
jgi:hypothetical protein